MNKSIEITNLFFSYRSETILQNINLSVFENELLAVFGPNGGGKTTLIKLILGLIKPDKGDIRIFGRNPKYSSEFIGYVPQYGIYDTAFPVTAEEVVLMGRLSGRKLFKKYNDADRQKSLECLDVMGMGENAKNQFSNLSGGQKQRVLIARALACEPKIILMDEPLAGVDICAEFGFYGMLKEIKKTKTVIIVSHDIGVVSSYVDRIACLNKVLVCHDTKEETLKNLNQVYNCPVEVIAHGIPHRVLGEHNGNI